MTVNRVTSVHNKSVRRLLEEMNSTKASFAEESLRYVDKEKALEWLVTIGAPLAPGNSSSTQKLLNATNIIESFENPTISDEKNISFRDNLDTEKGQGIENQQNKAKEKISQENDSESFGERIEKILFGDEAERRE